MYILVARMLAKPGEEKVIEEAIPELVKLSRQEPGMLQYIAHRSTDNPREFMFYEQYPDEAAYKAHTETPHYKKFVLETIAPRLEQRDRTLWTEIDPAQ